MKTVDGRFESCERCYLGPRKINTSRGGYSSTLFDATALWGSEIYFINGTFQFSLDDEQFEPLCPCCGKCMGARHSEPSHPAAHFSAAPCAEITDVANLDFGMLREVLSDQWEHSNSEPDWRGEDADSHVYDMGDAGLEIVTKVIDELPIILNAHLTYGPHMFNYLVLICPSDPDTIGIAWVHLDAEYIPIRHYRARIPASQLPKLPMHIVIRPE